jgi:hypothetical protein
MATLLPREQVTLARSIRNSAAVFLVMLMIERVRPGRAVTIYEVAPILEMDIRTAEKHMQSLCASNRAVYDGRGYTLMEGSALFLGMDTQAQAYALTDHALVEEIQPHTQAVAFDRIAQQALTSSAQSLQITQSLQGNYSTHKLCASKSLKTLNQEEEESKLNQESSPSALRVAQNVLTVNDDLTTERVLAATPMLDKFSLGVLTAGLNPAVIDPRLALAWIAQAYSQRERLFNPAGLVHSRLKDPTSPRPYPRFYEGYLSYLPDDFLMELGLMDAQIVQEIIPEPEQEEPAELLILDEMAVEMWEGVKAGIKSQIEKGPYNTWVDGTFGIALDDVLTVGAGSQYATDWLTNRITEIAEGLAGMRVCFVVASVD